MSHHRLALLAAAALSLAACAAKEQPPADSTQPAAATPAATPAAAPSAGSEQTPDAGGKVIEVLATTDAQGNNVFQPADFDAGRGDVIRFKLGQGVHNAHFLPDSNPGKQGLPPAGEMMQLPGQTFDVKVTWEPGTYYYQCDPHALLGMKGHVTVK
jgi:plastocyanin